MCQFTSFQVLKCIEPSVTVSKLRDSIDHSVCLYAYNKHVIKQFGVQHLKVSSGNKTKVIPFFIVDSRCNPIVGLSHSVALKLIKLNAPMYNTWSSNNPVSTIAAVGTEWNHDTVQNNEFPKKLTKQWIVDSPKYRHLFQGIGKFKINPVSVTLQRDATPVQKPPRKVPLAMQKAFKEELDSMEQQGIISKYDTKRNKAPEWLNTFVIFKKPNGKLRVCLDPTTLNQYIVWPVCNSLTLDEIVNKLKGAVFFAVFDTTKGFFHIPIDADPVAYSYADPIWYLYL